MLPPAATQDVTPEMIVNFLPAGALPEPAQNPHPIHLLIHPADGKTKDFFVRPCFPRPSSEQRASR